MSYLKIGSGDTTKLLSGTGTKGYAELWRKFLDENPPHYNSFASPIDALRTGAILEDVYFRGLPENYYPQVKHVCEEIPCLVSSVDFSIMEDGKLIDFEELKTIYLTDYIETICPLAEMHIDDAIPIIMKKFKSNYNQVQFQLLCTGLDSAVLSFLSVEHYNDEDNAIRVIEEKDVKKFRIQRNEDVIDLVRERGSVFQGIKDHLSPKKKAKK